MPWKDRTHRFTACKCDRCGKTTGRGGDCELFTLRHNVSDSRILDVGSFCHACLDRYSESDWMEWLQLNRPELFQAEVKTREERQPIMITLTKAQRKLLETVATGNFRRWLRPASHTIIYTDKRTNQQFRVATFESVREAGLIRVAYFDPDYDYKLTDAGRAALGIG